MPITLTDASLPIFKMGLANLAHCLDKAASNASQRSFSPDAVNLHRNLTRVLH